MASLGGAGAAPQGSAVALPVNAQADGGEDVAALPATGGSVASRKLPAEALPQPARAPGVSAAAADAPAGVEADAQAFARLLPVAPGGSPPEAIAIAVPLEAATRSQAQDPGSIASRAVPEAAPRADALPVMAGAAADEQAEAAPAVRVAVPASFGSPGWNGAFADRVTWMAQARQPSAELTLNPPQLGPVEVRVSVSADQQATLSFHSPHPAVREAIQGSLPRLQEAFAASGLQLGEVFVGSGAAGSGRDQGAARDSGGEPGRRSGGAAAVNTAPAEAPATWLRNGSLGQVDLFA
jgi:flagellar hook-length control protein FliK